MKATLRERTTGPRERRRFFSCFGGGVLAVAVVLGSFAGCSTMPNPAKRLVNHVGNRAREIRMRDQIENDKFPTAKEAGLE